MGGASFSIISDLAPFWCFHQVEARSLPAEGVSGHWKLRCLVHLMGKVLWPGYSSLTCGERRALATETSVDAWALHVSVPNTPLMCAG